MHRALLVVVAAAVAAILAPLAAAIAFTDASFQVPNAYTGTPYSHTFEIRAGGGCPPYHYRVLAGSLPSGLSLDANTGAVTGIPRVTGDYSFWLEGSDTPPVCVAGDTRPPATTERQFSIRILQGLQIVQRESSLGGAFVNEAYSLQLSATGGTGTWRVLAGALPPGVSLDAASGLLAGTPSAVGDYSFKIQISDGTRADAQTYTLSVVPKLQVALATRAAEVGVTFRSAPQASGGRPGYTWSIPGEDTLPAGLSFDPTTGVITGTPTAPGTVSVQLTLTDSLGLTASVTESLRVVKRLTLPVQRLVAAHVGRMYRQTIATTGGVAPRRWKLLSRLPAGLRLQPRTGRLVGTPSSGGVFRLRVSVTDELGVRTVRGLLLRVTG
jgi:hypothetical protein